MYLASRVIVNDFREQGLGAPPRFYSNKRPPVKAAFVIGRLADQAPWRLSSTFHLPPS